VLRTRSLVRIRPEAHHSQYRITTSAVRTSRSVRPGRSTFQQSLTRTSATGPNEVSTESVSDQVTSRYDISKPANALSSTREQSVTASHSRARLHSSPSLRNQQSKPEIALQRQPKDKALQKESKESALQRDSKENAIVKNPNLSLRWKRPGTFSRNHSSPSTPDVPIDLVVL